jgi:2,4-didehydro-3-deoxy-L-rhamnonate hydrolase
VGKIICVGLNFRDHARESGMALPEQPILFMKATSAICGPDDDVIIPSGSTKTDWEVELGVVIGDVARSVSLERALEHVAGYLIINDVSERAYQLEHGGQWVKGKSCDTFAPMGPMLVTADEVPDPQNLTMWLEVNGHRYQNGTTADMIFGVAHLVSYISRYMTLLPGDVISTGTPAGVGLGQHPPTYLKVGDLVELGIEGLGRQRQRFVAAGGAGAANT